MNLLEGRTLWELVERRVAAAPDELMAIDEDGRRLTFGDFRVQRRNGGSQGIRCPEEVGKHRNLRSKNIRVDRLAQTIRMRVQYAGL